jgi:hemolysin activation/secretion protein
MTFHFHLTHRRPLGKWALVSLQLFLTGLSWICFLSSAWAIDVTGSMNRPGAEPLPPPEFQNEKPVDKFVLPKIPDSGANSLDHRLLYIKQIVLEGNQVFPAEELNVLVQPYEGRNVSVAELEQLRLKLTHYYMDHGYVNSGAVIAKDAYRDGELRIKIIEGRIEEVRIKGMDGLRDGYVANRLVDDPDKAFNLQNLQDNYQLLLSDPLISRINGRIIPGTSPGTSILDLDVTRAQPYKLSVFGNNQRPPSIGAEAFGVYGQLRNLTGLGDSLDFTYITSDGSNRYSGGISVPITDAGTLAFFRFDEGDSMVLEQPINVLNITSLVHSFEGGISHPVINTPRQRLSLGVLLAVRENETSLLGMPFSFVPGEPTGRNQATVWRIFQDFSQRWDNHALALHSGFNVGMNALGATPSRPVPSYYQSYFSRYPSSDFFSWLGQAQYAWRFMDNGAQLVLRGNAQFSNSPLLPLERIAIGGFNTVRGYRENQLVRDDGYNISAELHYPLIGGDADAKHKLTLVPFVDYGKAWYVDQPTNSAATTLFSLGVGLEWQFKPLFAQLYYGYALNTSKPQQTGDLQDSGIHFSARWDMF